MKLNKFGRPPFKTLVPLMKMPETPFFSKIIFSVAAPQISFLTFLFVAEYFQNCHRVCK